MTTLLLSNSPQVGGGNRSLLLLANGLQSVGTSVRIVTPAEGPMAEVCRTEGLPYQVNSTGELSWRFPRQAWLSYRRWRKLLRASNARIVHANDILTARSVAIAAWRLGLPVVCHVRFAPGSGAAAWAFRRLPKPAAFIFNSHALQAECGPDIEKSCPKARQYVIHNAVDLKRFYPRAKRTRKNRVGILANLMPVKGHRDYLQMARLLADRGVSVEHWIIGEDIHETGYRVELELLRCQLNLCESVKFLGHRSDVPELLTELDALVCASHVEPFGRCLIEAMACEIPVVATRVGGIPEVVNHGQTGLLVTKESPGAMADAVSRLLGDPALSARMGKAGKKRVDECFTSDAHTAAVMDVYRTIDGRSGT